MLPDLIIFKTYFLKTFFSSELQSKEMIFEEKLKTLESLQVLFEINILSIPSSIHLI